jgi:diguanylate cyclase (GGDEF)-like protein
MREFHASEESFLAFVDSYFSALEKGHDVAIEYKAKKKDGSFVWCEIAGRALHEGGEQSFKDGVIWSVNDISQRKALEEQLKQRSEEIESQNRQLEKLASLDYLTGLYNRSKIGEFLELKIKHAGHRSSVFGVALLDVDFFKEVNDLYGHQSGDIVLREFSTLLKENVREGDIVGRWGGEEFLLIIEEMNRESFIDFTQNLRKTIEKHDFSVVKHKTASFGVTLFKDGDDSDTIVSRVDEALYAAKKGGRNQVCFID